MSDFITNGAAVLPAVKSDARTPTGAVTEWAADDSNQLRQAALDLRTQAIQGAADLAVETSARTVADAAETVRAQAAEQAIIAAGVPVALSGASFVQGPGTTARTLDAWMGDVINVKNFGAVGNGVADDTAAIQAAIDYALLMDIATVYMPCGTYKVSDTIHVGYGLAYCTVAVEGDVSYGADASIGQARTRIQATFVDRPIVNIQGGRHSGIRRLWLSGPDAARFTLPWSLGFVYSSDPNNYIPTGSQTAINAPSCAVCIDGYSGTKPATYYPRPQYPAMYGASIPAVGSEYGRSTSSQCFVTDCRLDWTLVGVALQPNSNSNGDFMDFSNTEFGGHQVAISIGNTNARSTNMANCLFSGVYSMLDNHTYAIAGSNGNFGGDLSNWHANMCWQIFDVNMDYTVASSMRNFYAENIHKIGVMSGGKSTFSFIGCSFELRDSTMTGYVVTEQMSDFVLESTAPIIFESCIFAYPRTVVAFSGVPQFNNCIFTTLSFFSDSYFSDAAEKFAARNVFKGVIVVPNPELDTQDPIFDSCRGTSGVGNWSLLGGDSTAGSIHGTGISTRSFIPYLMPIMSHAGSPQYTLLPVANRTQTGRGFTIDRTDTRFQVNDIIITSATGTVSPTVFYLASITDLGGGNYRHQWDALNNFTYTTAGGYTVPGWNNAWVIYFPLIWYTPNVARFFKTTSGSADVEYVDINGASQNVGAAFTDTRRILWQGNNNGWTLFPHIPFLDNVKINTISGSTITMSQNARVTAWYADAPGLCLVKWGA